MTPFKLALTALLTIASLGTLLAAGIAVGKIISKVDNVDMRMGVVESKLDTLVTDVASIKRSVEEPQRNAKLAPYWAR